MTPRLKKLVKLAKEAKMPEGLLELYLSSSNPGLRSMQVQNWLRKNEEGVDIPPPALQKKGDPKTDARRVSGKKRRMWLGYFMKIGGGQMRFVRITKLPARDTFRLEISCKEGMTKKPWLFADLKFPKKEIDGKLDNLKRAGGGYELTLDNWGK